MATVSTTVTPTQNYLPFTGFIPGRSDESADARAQIIASTVDASIGATGVGDNQEIVIDLRLPVNFAYAMTDFMVGIQAASGATYNFGLRADLQVVNAASNSTIQLPLGSTTPGVALIDGFEKATYCPDCSWSGILLPATSSDQIRIIWNIWNSTANDTAYTLDCAARFLQYDISQSLNLNVNTPIPVR